VLRENLWQLIEITDQPGPQIPRTVAEILKQRRGSESERAMAYVALAKTAGLEADLARGKTTSDLYALVRVKDQW
jgi:hypothetical protein